MLSYRHAFHAGNLADVHKHVAYQLGIQSLLKKPAAFCLLDAYAGAGQYDLTSAVASKTGEWRGGIAQVLAMDAPEPLQPWLRRVRDLNPGDDLHVYPGSPLLAAASLRPQDRLVCLELHPADHGELARLFARNRQVEVHRRDAREGLPALLPPRERRGLVLVDPPYERAEEYREVPAMLRKAHSRWPTGGFLLWYPLLAGNPHVSMIDAIANSGIRKVLVHELLLLPAAPGLRGSGLLWINPPWGIDAGLRRGGQWLAERLGEEGAASQLEWRVPE